MQDKYPNIRTFFWLPILLALLACSVNIPSFQRNPTHPVALKNLVSKATHTRTPTLTPFPSATPTPTPLPPEPTTSPVLSLTPSPTSLPLDTQLAIFDDLWSIVNDTYVYPDFNGLDWVSIRQEYQQKIKAGLTNEQFYQAMSDVITRLGDDHSFYLDPRQVAQQEAEYQGKLNYVGIGILISAVPERQHGVILSVFPGSPAEAAGLQPRDSIISVNGTPILDQDGYLRDIVRGPEGTTISLEVQTPGGQPREMQITRHKITGGVPVEYQVINTPDGKRIGYIFLVTFNDSTVDDQVAEALRQMTATTPLDGLILDNRMNEGGSSSVFEPILSYFVGGDLGSFISRSEERPLVIKLDDIHGSSKVPLVVLVGSGTVSFGEIFSGILQDTGRAYLIGKTTGGNVEILWGYDLEDGSQLWLANETFHPKNHPDQNWEATGIVPSQTVSGDFDEFTLENDPVVSAAVAYLSSL